MLERIQNYTTDGAKLFELKCDTLWSFWFKIYCLVKFLSQKTRVANEYFKIWRVVNFPFKIWRFWKFRGRNLIRNSRFKFSLTDFFCCQHQKQSLHRQEIEDIVCFELGHHGYNKKVTEDQSLKTLEPKSFWWEPIWHKNCKKTVSSKNYWIIATLQWFPETVTIRKKKSHTIFKNPSMVFEGFVEQYENQEQLKQDAGCTEATFYLYMVWGDIKISLGAEDKRIDF